MTISSEVVYLILSNDYNLPLDPFYKYVIVVNLKLLNLLALPHLLSQHLTHFLVAYGYTGIKTLSVYSIKQCKCNVNTSIPASYTHM